ncbi:Protein bli-3 [Homalodisca vitripennis]|nr:Protein bli-3 [Homalodisca vitripennis]
MTRKSPPAYSDGVYMLAGQDRPSPRKLSTLFMKGDDGMGSLKNRTALLAFFDDTTLCQKRRHRFSCQYPTFIRAGVMCDCVSRTRHLCSGPAFSAVTTPWLDY